MYGYDLQHMRFCFDPTNWDTDGDGVPDGVEITENYIVEGRFDAEGNQLGRWPD